MRRTSLEENFLTAAFAGGIEASEARGQRELCASSELPKDMHPSREAFENLGIKFGSEDETGLFLHAELPQGWKVESTDHSMWNKLVNDKGEEIASIFYKAAFYDRKASMSLTNSKSVEG